MFNEESYEAHCAKFKNIGIPLLHGTCKTSLEKCGHKNASEALKQPARMYHIEGTKLYCTAQPNITDQ